MTSLRNFFTGFKTGFHFFGHSISTIINSALLLVVYIAGVGLTFVFAKLLKKYFFATKLEKDSQTYWTELNLRKEKIESYYQQF